MTRVMVTALTRRQFADLAKTTRPVGTFAFLERVPGADFAACGDPYVHRAPSPRCSPVVCSAHGDRRGRGVRGGPGDVGAA
jgi:hypothetical protein